MRTEVTPARATVSGQSALTFTVTITNTSSVISGYRIRVLGLDPAWVETDQAQLSLFPDTTGVVTVVVKPPPMLPAGEQRFAIQVRELTPPHESAILDVDLEVPAAPTVRVRTDPVSVTAGRSASLGVLVENDGNTRLLGKLVGRDDEEKIRYRFVPPLVDLPPGEHAAVELKVRARRRFAGQPVVRTFRVLVDDGSNGDEETLPRANASFMQRPLLSRGAISLLGLLASVTVFALVITYALSNVVGRSAADRDLALQVAQAQNETGNGGTASLSGAVHDLTTGAPVSGLEVGLFAASDTATALATAATDPKGRYRLDQLAAGNYKLRFRGASYSDVWYPQSPTDSDATAVTLETGQDLTGLDVRVGGLPATVSGKVTPGDLPGGQVTLQVPGTPQPVGPNGRPRPSGAVLQTVPIGSDGSFSLANVPSPSVYDLVVTAPGYAPETQRVDVASGEDRSDILVQLQKGDGAISGVVTSKAGAVPDATITATYNQTIVQTVSGANGAFELTNLPTPAAFSVVVSAHGFASQTLTLTLTSGQKLTGVGVTLGGAAGTLEGNVTVRSKPAAGVNVTVSNGVLTISTVTQTTGDVGFWSVQGLAVPSTYTVTFGRDDLASQTLSVSIDAFGTATMAVSPGATVSSSGITIDLSPATATFSGVTKELRADGSRAPVGEVQVALSSGSANYTETSASVPASDVGSFVFDHLPPGTYTVTVSRKGTRPTTSLITLKAGEDQSTDLVLGALVSICGQVTSSGTGGQPLPNLPVVLYKASDYPKTSVATTSTSSTGQYCFSGLDAPENYIVELDYPAAGQPYSTQRITLKTKPETADFTVDVNP